MTSLNRTVPFLATALTEPLVVLDRFTFPPASLTANHPVIEKIEVSLSLQQFTNTVDAETAVAIASEQYVAGSEFVYGHPIWEDIRSGSQAAVYAYLLETRHYLAAASSRMAPGIQGGIGLDPLTLLLSKHLIEEYDHAKFFEDALHVIGCPRNQITTARPLPSTLEWIHFTRAVASRDSLSAALCSGFMEYSSRESEAVIGWHRHLSKQCLIPDDANAAIFKHVETDLGFGHDKNWENAIQHVAPISTERFAAALNDVATLCEMIYRWLSVLRNGLSAYVVTAMSVGCIPSMAIESESTAVRAFSGLPVWASSVLHMVNHGGTGTQMASSVIGVAYSHGQDLMPAETADFENAVLSVCSTLAAPQAEHVESPKSLYQTARSWLRSIDGHELWQALVNRPSFSLVQGYILENYHYLASATRHISAAISSCPDGAIQLDLIAHLEDELEHCELLRTVLERTDEIRHIKRCRPLPTTVAFVGYLRDLGTTDWRGYLVASAFLQCSLAELRSDKRHQRFYSEVIKAVPEAKILLDPLQLHDDIDEDLGHDDRAARRLERLIQRHQIPVESFERAAITPLLAWGFLDGIVQHYQHGGASVTQRIAWEA